MNPFNLGGPREKEQQAYEKYCKFIREHGTNADYTPRSVNIENPWQLFCDKLSKKEASWKNFY